MTARLRVGIKTLPTLRHFIEIFGQAKSTLRTVMRRHGTANIDPDYKFDMSVLKLFLPYLKAHRGRVALALSFMMLAKVASVGLPFILKYIVDDLTPGLSTTATAMAVPIALVIAYGSVRFANVLFGEIRDTLFGRVTERIIRKIALNVFNHLHKLDLDFHLDRKTGGLSRDIERGTTGISFLMRFMIFNIVPTLMEITMVVALLFYNYGYGFAVIIVISVVSYVSYSIYATEWRTRYIREANEADSSSSTQAIDSLLNFETVKYFNNEQFEANRFDKGLAALEAAKRKNRLSLFVLNGGQALIIAVAITAMMALAATHVSEGIMTLGDFVLINAFMMQIFMPLNFLGFVYREIKGSLANIERLFKLLEKQPNIVDTTDAKALVVEAGAIEFDQLCFAYRPDRPILKNISFTIGPGEKVAVVGPSGAGKSTLAKLLFRFYDSSSGDIIIDGQKVKQLTQASLRQAIGVVPQDTVLFNDSIFENVRYGRPDASDDEVKEAIKLAHLGDFISALPDGASTTVGERGLKLSGGEKQRVAIARTILKRPPILIFDEATSSLDSHSEQAILAAIEDIAQNHTSLVIAHRLSTIIDADKIIVLVAGEVAEQGTHQQLLAQQGHYANLWQVQQQNAE
ncbi:MAG: ABC-type transport system involved in Fe-S cluster assembly fused permease/ATPase subunit [Phenylobacterium sp.]|jgi:ABC-type transport system involved in Fe-S cluster assembly fused permease/ATPase subunit